MLSGKNKHSEDDGKVLKTSASDRGETGEGKRETDSSPDGSGSQCSICGGGESLSTF